MSKSFTRAAFVATLAALAIAFSFAPAVAGSRPLGNTIHINNRLAHPVEVVFRDDAGKDVAQMNIRSRSIASGSMVGHFRMIVTVIEPRRRVTIEKTVTLSMNGAPVLALDTDNRGNYVILP